MNPAQLQAQANQTAAQGRAAQQQDIASQGAAQGQYNSDIGAYNTDTQNAQNALQAYQNYNANMTNPLTYYNQGISQAEQAEGFNPQSLATATQNLTQTQNALANVGNASQSATGGYGLSGAQLGAYYGSLSQPLQQAAQSQNNAVGNLQQLYQNALTQGQQGAQLGYQGEQLQSQNLNQAATQAQGIATLAQQQSAQALQNLQFYSQLAAQQGTWNAQNAQGYTNALASYQGAQAALQQAAAATTQANAQAALYGAETPGARAVSQAELNQLNANKNNGTALKVSSSPVATLKLGSNNGMQLGSNIPLQGNSSNLQGGGIKLQ